MVGPRNSKEPPRSPPKSQPSGATRRTAMGLLLGAPLLGACSGIQQTLSQFTTSGPAQEPIVAGTGQVKVGLILPLSAPGNAGVAAQSMKNAAEMALAEFQNPNLQLLIKDDGGNPQGAQQGAQQALDEGAEIILGPLFAASVPATALVPENAYGNVVEAAFKQAVGRRGGRIVAFEKYGADRATPARTVAQALGQADALLLADDGDSVVAMADALTARSE